MFRNDKKFQANNLIDRRLTDDTKNGSGGEYTGTNNTKRVSDILKNNELNESHNKWEPYVDDVINQILGRKEFSYDVNSDALYQQYADQYARQGKAAMEDAMGQAAAMTGGYGNSYAATVGNQVYQSYMQELDNVIPQLYQLALSKYEQEGQALYDKLGALASLDATEYAKYRDDVADTQWQAAFDYNKGRDDVADAQWQATFDYNKDINDAATKNTEYSKLVELIISTGYEPSSDELSKAGMSTEQAAAYKNYADKTNSDSGQSATLPLNETIMYGEDGKLKPGYTTTNPDFFDEYGQFKKATFSRTDGDGNNVWIIDGEEIVRQRWANPYTGTIHPSLQKIDDDKRKDYTFSNGYQPNFIARDTNGDGKIEPGEGDKLSKSGTKDYMNGVLQTVWKTPDGRLWIWDGTQNEYIEYDESEIDSNTNSLTGGINIM